MDGDITAIPSSNGEAGGGESSDTQTPVSCREIFDKAFGEYLVMGMSYDEFYNKDHTLVIAYKKAYERKRKETNTDLWLQGAYVYEAFVRVAPLLIPFAKKPKLEPYLKEPFPLFDKEEKKTEDAKSKAVYDKGFAYMQAQMNAINKKFGKTG